ncbi:striatin-3-like protein [Zopfochytrium polystomum]|nr:striatin-3-like protein [Zopfochytrium polystomum]
MPLLVTAHEDRYIRLFDLNTGDCTHSMIAHLDAVSSVDFLAGGTTLVSSGHDCSLRWWDLSSTSRTCIQEHTTHRRKLDEGIWCVRTHPTKANVMASGGADGLCKVFFHGDAKSV